VENHFEDLYVDRRIIVTCVKCEGVDWIHLPQERGQWRVLVNTWFLGFLKGEEFLHQLNDVSFSRHTVLH
jgi:hypothetical protein